MRNTLIGYFRVSTQRQSVEGNALERYEANLIRYGVAKANLYQDVESGGSMSRVGFNRLCDRIKRDQTIKAVVVPSHSRLHRDLTTWVTVRQLLLDHGVELIDLERGGKVVELQSIATTLDAAVAEEYRIVNTQRALDGHRHRRSRGRSCTLPFGYRLSSGDKDSEGNDIEDGICIPNHDPYHDTDITYWQAARKLIETYIETGKYKSTATIANQLWPQCQKKFDHPSSGSGIRTWIKNKTLRGHLVYFGWREYVPTNVPPKEHQKEQTIYNHHTALITPAEYEVIEDLVKHPSAPRGKRHRLAGLIRCAHCDRLLQQKKMSERGRKTKAYNYLRCQNYYTSYGKPKTCSGRVSARYEKVEGQIIEALMKNSQLVASRRKQPVEVAPDPKILELEAEIKALQNISGTDVLIEEKRKAIATLKNKDGDRPAVDAEKIKRLQEAAGNPLFWDVCTDDDKATIYRTLLESVTVDESGFTCVAFANS